MSDGVAEQGSTWAIHEPAAGLLSPAGLLRLASRPPAPTLPPRWPYSKRCSLQCSQMTVPCCATLPPHSQPAPPPQVQNVLNNVEAERRLGQAAVHKAPQEGVRQDGAGKGLSSRVMRVSERKSGCLRSRQETLQGSAATSLWQRTAPRQAAVVSVATCRSCRCQTCQKREAELPAAAARPPRKGSTSLRSTHPYTSLVDCHSSAQKLPGNAASTVLGCCASAAGGEAAAATAAAQAAAASRAGAASAAAVMFAGMGSGAGGWAAGLAEQACSPGLLLAHQSSLFGGDRRRLNAGRERNARHTPALPIWHVAAGRRRAAPPPSMRPASSPAPETLTPAVPPDTAEPLISPGKPAGSERATAGTPHFGAGPGLIETGRALGIASRRAGRGTRGAQGPGPRLAGLGALWGPASVPCCCTAAIRGSEFARDGRRAPCGHGQRCRSTAPCLHHCRRPVEQQQRRQR